MTDVRIATRKHLNLISSSIKTAWEGESFKPVKSREYQEVFLLSGDTQDFTFDNIKIGNYILQISLYYPSNRGVYDIEEKAKEVVSHFSRGTELMNGNTCVRVINTPSVANLGTIEDRIMRVISINLKTGE